MKKRVNSNLISKLKKIKLIASDFDGVFTDGTVFTDQSGIESVQCSRKDGLGIELLKRHGLSLHVISKERNPVVTARCNKLKITCDQAVEKSEGKVEILRRIMHDLNLQREQVAYIGDDLNDIPALKEAGIAITVADGHPAVIKIVDYVTKAFGGKHAIREIVELILTAKGISLNKF